MFTKILHRGFIIIYNIYPWGGRGRDIRESIDKNVYQGFLAVAITNIRHN